MIHSLESVLTPLLYTLYFGVNIILINLIELQNSKMILDYRLTVNQQKMYPFKSKCTIQECAKGEGI